jgi:hypothetical protein
VKLLKVRIALVFTALIALPVKQPAAQPLCALPQKPVVLINDSDAHKRGGRLLQVWEIADAPVLWSYADPASAGYRDFAAKRKEKVPNSDPLYLLAQAPQRNNALVAQNAKEWLRPATCLEKLLMGMQQERLDMFETPSEFSSFVLRSGKRVRIYFYTNNQDGLGRMTPVTDPIRKDVQQGWRLQFGLHNHPFHPGKPEQNGPPAPSVPDAHFHYNARDELGLAEARITNGVDTVRIPADAFDRFER